MKAKKEIKSSITAVTLLTMAAILSACGSGGTDDTSTPQQAVGLADYEQIASDHIYMGDWKAVDGGGGHSIAIKKDGSLWAWGINLNGEVGVGSSVISISKPTLIAADYDWQAVSAGHFSSFAIKNDGTLWSWGKNDQGQLGQGHTENRNIPTQVGSDSDWQTVNGGHAFALALKKDGTLWGWGVNSNAELGDSNTTSKKIPTQIGSDTDWKEIEACEKNSLALKKDGTFWGWGSNEFGQLGDGTKLLKNTPAQIGSATDWKTIKLAEFHALGLKNDGTIWSWGKNTYGSLGDGTVNDHLQPQQMGSDTNWQKIEVSSEASFAIKEDGSAWSWGYNFATKLGFFSLSSEMTTTTTPTPIGGIKDVHMIATGQDFTFWIKKDGKMSGWGSSLSNLGTGVTNVNGQLDFVAGTDRNWKMIRMNEYFTMGLKHDGTVWVWGVNYSNGMGLTTNGGTFLRPTLIYSYDHVLLTVRSMRTVDLGGAGFGVGIKNNGTLWTWGEVANLYLGQAPHTYSPAIQERHDGRDWLMAEAGQHHIIALKNDGSLWAWGVSDHGQVGDGTVVPFNFYSGAAGTGLVPIKISNDTNWKTISAGALYNLALKTDGTLWAWGQNNEGQLGDGTREDKNVSIQIGSDTNWQMFQAGSEHSVAIKNDGTLWVWGDNSANQLGDGTLLDKLIPTQLGSDSWKDVSTGDKHTIAIKKDGTLWAWGNNTYGQQGDGSFLAKAIPTQIGSDNDWKSVEADSNHNFATKESGSLWAWGRNDRYQLGNSTLTASVNRPKMVDITWKESPSSNTPVINAGFTAETTDRVNQGQFTNAQSRVGFNGAGYLFAQGDNSYGQLGLGDTVARADYVQSAVDYNITNICISDKHSAAILADGSLWSWGDNSQEALGYPTTDSNISSSMQQVGSDSNWKRVACGAGFTVGLKNDGTLWGWGTYKNFTTLKSVTLLTSDVKDLRVVGAIVSIEKSNGTVWQSK